MVGDMVSKKNMNIEEINIEMMNTKDPCEQYNLALDNFVLRKNPNKIIFENDEKSLDVLIGNCKKIIKDYRYKDPGLTEKIKRQYYQEMCEVIYAN